MNAKKSFFAIILLLIIVGGIFYNQKRKMYSARLKGGIILRDIREHKGYCCGKSGGRKRESKEEIVKRIKGPEDKSLMDKIDSKDVFISQHTQTLPVTIYTIEDHGPSKYAVILLELNDIAYTHIDMTNANEVASLKLQNMAKKSVNGADSDFEIGYPFIFIGNYFVNGFENLLEIDSSGMLESMVFKAIADQQKIKKDEIIGGAITTKINEGKDNAKKTVEKSLFCRVSKKSCLK